MIPPTLTSRAAGLSLCKKILKKKKNKRNSEIQTPGIEKLPSMLTKNNFALIHVMVEPYFLEERRIKARNLPIIAVEQAIAAC